MEERIVKFISALRSAGLRVSLAETEDAFRAIEQMGVQEKVIFRTSLRSTLVKEEKNLSVFDELFPLFFGESGNPPMMNLSEDLTPEEAQMLAQALQQYNERLREMLNRLIKGEPLTQEELERIGRLVGLNHADDLRYREWMAERMKKALHFKDVREALKEMAELLAQMGMDKQRVEQLRKLLQANQDALSDQIRQFSGQHIAENLSRYNPENDLDSLLKRPFNALSERDMDRLRREVRRLAAVLRTWVSLRQKKAKSGQLDAKATLRANLKHGNVPIQIKHRQHSLKPKLAVLCDVSTSMRSCSELMLGFIYALQDLIHKTHAFAFIDHLEYISPSLSGREARTAVSEVLAQMPAGYYNTNMGHSLLNFTQNFMDTVDRRTTLIIVGDGRNNYNDPRLDLFRAIVRRSHRVIWINPEGPALWGTGDSDMREYASECDIILKVNNLSELAAAVDRLLDHR